MTRRLAALLSLALLLSTAALAQTPAPTNSGGAPDQQLWDATRRGDAAGVRAAIAKGANVNAKWRYDQTPLFKAAERGDAEIVKILLDNKADPNIRDTFYGATPLYWATDKGHTEVVRALVAKGATGSEDVLLTGVRTGNVEYVKIALGQGETPPATLTRALTLSGVRHGAEKDEAVRTKHAEIAALLKAAGAQPGFQVEPAVLKSYEGAYKNEQGQEWKVAVNEQGYLTVAPAPTNVFIVVPSDKVTFQPIEFGGIQITFNVEGESVTGLTFKQGQAAPVVYRRQ
ncbi:MAG TPA: ankyrin repeat domain-containing protein [Pyrinomonadaceae bacterium]|nr:ankyrin repeat domain-containing protein [Pyrinomonadaceae bacterium]